MYTPIYSQVIQETIHSPVRSPFVLNIRLMF